MTFIFWIEAINSGGAKEYKQGHLHFLPKLSSLRGVLSLNLDTHSTPNFEAIHPYILYIK